MEENKNKEFEPQLLKIPRKIEEIQEWTVQAGSSISSVTHKNRENKILISDLKRDYDEYKKTSETIIDANSSTIEDLKTKLVILTADIANVKSGMDKVEQKFTWTKIFVVGMAVITGVAGAISSMVVILKNLGIFDKLK